MSELPKEYSYGLSTIELLPRNGNEIGSPYGVYQSKEKKIIIYSLPGLVWNFGEFNNFDDDLYKSHGASISRENKKVIVSWVDGVDVAFFVYREVLLHEIGHHYDFQYKTKRAIQGLSL